MEKETCPCSLSVMVGLQEEPKGVRIPNATPTGGSFPHTQIPFNLISEVAGAEQSFERPKREQLLCGKCSPAGSCGLISQTVYGQWRCADRFCISRSGRSCPMWCLWLIREFSSAAELGEVWGMFERQVWELGMFFLRSDPL